MQRLILSLLAIAVMMGPQTASAFEFSQPASSGNVRVESGQRVDDTLFAAGADVDLRGEVTKDAYVAGSAITLDGTVAGTLLAGGSSVKVNGTVGGDLIAAAGTATIGKDAIVTGDVLVFAGVVEILGTVHGDVNVYAGTVSVAGTVDGTVTTQSEKFLLQDGASILGNVSGQVTTPFEPNDQATVQGTIELETTTSSTQLSSWTAQAGALNVVSTIYSFLSLLVIGLILYFLAPKLVEQSRKSLVSDSGQHLLIGLVTIVLAPIAFILLLMLVITIPLGLLLLLILGLLAFCGSLLANLWLGDALTQGKWPPLSSFLLGAVSLMIVGLIPLIGPLLTILAWLVGFGAVCRATWAWYQKQAR